MFRFLILTSAACAAINERKEQLAATFQPTEMRVEAAKTYLPTVNAGPNYVTITCGALAIGMIAYNSYRQAKKTKEMMEILAGEGLTILRHEQMTQQWNEPQDEMYE